MQETVVFLDEGASEAVCRAAEFLQRHGMVLSHQTPYSVAFLDPDASPAVGGQPATVRPLVPVSEGELPPGTGQIAAVPVQLRPEWTRVWVTVNDDGHVAEVAEAYVAQHRSRSRQIETAVRDLEQDIYDEANWPVYEARLRGSLQKQGTDETEIEAKIATFKQRWLALGRKASKSPEA
jgi:hypothetical protein